MEIEEQDLQKSISLEVHSEKVQSEQLQEADMIPPEAYHLITPICPFRGVSSKSTIVDESEEFPEPVEPQQQLVEDAQPEQKRNFAQLYLSQCQKYGVTPLSLIRSMLAEVDLSSDVVVKVDLNRFGCSNLQIQIILDCMAQACPDRLKLLILSFNLLMDVPLATSLANLLQASQNIAELNLSHTRMCDEVVRILAEALATSSVRSLNMANCQISDAGGVALFGSLVLSDCIKKVDASWNRLEHRSGVAAGLFLAGNASIQELTLEGNYLYLEKECIVPFLKELAKNTTLKTLNLAWNALRGSHFGPALYKALISSGLEVLNLEMNCLRSDEAIFLLRAFRRSEVLREIYLGGNFFNEDDLKELVKAFGKNDNLKVLSLGKYQFISKVAGRLSKRLMTRDPSKSVTFQGILMVNPPRSVDVPEMLLDRCRFLGLKPKKKKLKRDLGHLMLQFLKLEDPFLQREDFVALVKKFRIKLDKSLMESLMDAFTDRKMVDSSTMAQKYLGKYPTEPPPVKVKKPKGKKKRGTNVKKKKF